MKILETKQIQSSFFIIYSEYQEYFYAKFIQLVVFLTIDPVIHIGIDRIDRNNATWLFFANFFELGCSF
jgi:hypothetical protein